MLFAGLFTVLLLGAFALGMVALLVLGLKNVWRGLASTDWPSTEGIVSKVEMTTSTSRDTHRRNITTTYHAELNFRYSVNGRDYGTDQVRWGQILGSGDATEAVVLALSYPEGRRVKVHYNPRRPEEGVVKPGLTGSAFLLPGAALAFLLFLVPGCFIAARLLLTPQPTPFAPALNITPFMRAFLCIPMLMGAPMLVHGTRNLILASRSTEWPTTTGAWLRDLPEGAVTGIDAVRQHRGFDFVYRYETPEGPRFQSLRWLGQGTATGNDSESEIALSFPRGQPLTVFYNPADPDTAVLRTGIQPFTWALPGAGVAFILFGVIGITAVGRR